MINYPIEISETRALTPLAGALAGRSSKNIFYEILIYSSPLHTATHYSKIKI